MTRTLKRKSSPTPEQAEAWSAAGRKAAAARHSLDTIVRQIVDRAPELTPEQIERLRPILADVA